MNITTLKSINPATGELIKKIQEWNKEKIDNQLVKSSKVFQNWKKNNFNHRADILKDVAKTLNKNKSSCAKLISTEMGKPIGQAEAEVEKCAWVCNFYADNGKDFLKNEFIKTDAEKSYIQFLPLGIILGIMPWNFPFWQVFRWAAPSLMAGNVCLLKHSSNVPQCANIIQDIFVEAGMKDNIFKNIPISSSKTSSLIQDGRISAISLTGSTNAGSKTAELAGKFLKKTVLELGGSDPFIIFDDADIDYSCDIAVKARMLNNGQSCIAAKRFIITKNVFEEFAEKITQKVEKLVVGNPLYTSTDIGPLASLDIVKTLDEQVKNSVDKGAFVLTGGQKLEDNPGFFYIPTVITKVKKSMPVYNEETFGPVATLIKVEDEKQAIQVANDTSFGLGASIWTENIKKAEKLSKCLQAGNVFINEMVKSDPRLPFGGIKKSGYGRELSDYGIKEFVNIQTLYIK